MIHIVAVDDDHEFLCSITFALTVRGYMVKPLENGRDLLRYLRGQQPDLILLDRVLPDIDGFNLCKKIKLRYPEQCLMMFSSLGEVPDVIEGLSLGADDYIPKPFPPELLLAKVETLLRRSGRQELQRDVLTERGLVLNLREFRLTLDGAVVEVTKTEFELLALLLGEVGQMVTYETILSKTLGYGEREGDYQVIYFHIASLRKKLGSYRKCIKTVRERGYRYVPGPMGEGEGG